MTSYYGDITEDQTIRIPFNTFDSNDPSASVTVTNLVAADIKVHKNGATSPLSTDGATISIDHNAVAGAHMVIIDTSAHADYSTGADYDVRLEGITVDGGQLNAWVGSFSIQNRYMRGTNSAATETKQDVIDGIVDTILVDTADMQPRVVAIEVDTGTTLDGKVTVIDGIVDSILVDTGTTIPGTITTIDNEIATIDGIVDTILVDTADMQPRVAAIEVDTGTTLDGKITTIDGIVDSILVDTGTTIPGTITTIDNEIATIDGIVDAILVDTAELQTDDVPGKIAALDTVVDRVETDTQDIQTQIGTAGVGLSNLGGMSTSMKAEVNTQVDTAFTTQIADSVPSDGTLYTRDQALYIITQMLTEMSISGTTMTIKKVDGSTSLLTLTLSDATNPTSITRAS